MKKIPKHIITASILCIFVIAAVVYLAIVFRSAKTEEPIYAGQGVTEVRKLSTWFPGLAGTSGDTDVYILDSGVSGASMLVCLKSTQIPLSSTGSTATPWIIKCGTGFFPTRIGFTRTTRTVLPLSPRSKSSPSMRFRCRRHAIWNNGSPARSPRAAEHSLPRLRNTLPQASTAGHSIRRSRLG